MKDMSKTPGVERLFKTLNDSLIPSCFCAHEIETKEPLAGWLAPWRKKALSGSEEARRI